MRRTCTYSYYTHRQTTNPKNNIKQLKDTIMKKMILSLVAVMMAATATYAQSSMLATLSHNGKISTYYGASALREAVTEASNGDVITLSSGSFNAVDLTKAITIRGAGMAVDGTAQTEPTIIAGDFSINISEDTNNRLTIEGIYHNHTITINSNFKNGTFLKDRLLRVRYSNATVTNLTMIHCKVVGDIYMNGSASFVNSVVCNPYVNNNANIEYVNSIVIKSEQYFDNSLGYSQFKNCILVALANASSSNRLTNDCVAYNCVALGRPTNMFGEIPNTTNSEKAYTDIFKTYAGVFNDNENFELIDNAQTAYLGIDGTQIGIYGGNMPFSTTPTNPQITKCNVAAKSTADGKLSVDITVSGAE